MKKVYPISFASELNAGIKRKVVPGHFRQHILFRMPEHTPGIPLHYIELYFHILHHRHSISKIIKYRHHYNWEKLKMNFKTWVTNKKLPCHIIFKPGVIITNTYIMPPSHSGRGLRCHSKLVLLFKARGWTGTRTQLSTNTWHTQVVPQTA